MIRWWIPQKPSSAESRRNLCHVIAKAVARDGSLHGLYHDDQENQPDMVTWSARVCTTSAAKTLDQKRDLHGKFIDQLRMTRADRLTARTTIEWSNWKSWCSQLFVSIHNGPKPFRSAIIRIIFVHPQSKMSEFGYAPSLKSVGTTKWHALFLQNPMFGHKIDVLFVNSKGVSFQKKCGGTQNLEQPDGFA